MTVAVLYGRPGCHLCDEARAALRAAARGRPVEIVERDIEADDRLLRAYLERIPVVEVDGDEVCDLDGCTPAVLERALSSISRR